VKLWLSANHWYATVVPFGAYTAMSTSALVVVALVTSAVMVTGPPAVAVVGETREALTKPRTGAGVAVGAVVAVAVGAVVGDAVAAVVGDAVAAVVAVAVGAGTAVAANVAADSVQLYCVP
jgi:hypothetical protein